MPDTFAMEVLAMRSQRLPGRSLVAVLAGSPCRFGHPGHVFCSADLIKEGLGTLVVLATAVALTALVGLARIGAGSALGRPERHESLCDA